MAIKTEKELNETQRSHWLKAVAAIELRNFGYAISLLQGILKQEPQFLTGRQLLRRTEVTKSKSAKKSFFNISTAPIAVMKAQREIKKDPKRAMEMLENILEDEPYNRQANFVLKEAAIAAGWPEIGVFALRTLLEENPRDVKVLRELGRLHHDLGENERAVEIYNQITDINPLDAEALRLGKDASARASMTTGGWTQAITYRDLIKDKEIAVSLEQQSRMRLTGESLDQQIAETYAFHQVEDARKSGGRNPTDLQLRFELGEHLVNAGHFRQALPELQRARQNPNARLKAMNLLGRCYSELGMLDLAMKQLEEASQEILPMDAMKKEIVYNLGLVYERMGAMEKSLNCMKQIYEADYGYKDVASRVESSYNQNISQA